MITEVSTNKDWKCFRLIGRPEFIDAALLMAQVSNQFGAVDISSIGTLEQKITIKAVCSYKSNMNSFQNNETKEINRYWNFYLRDATGAIILTGYDLLGVSMDHQIEEKKTYWFKNVVVKAKLASMISNTHNTCRLQIIDETTVEQCDGNDSLVVVDPQIFTNLGDIFNLTKDTVIGKILATFYSLLVI